MYQKLKQQGFLQYSLPLYTLEKDEIGSFIKARIRIKSQTSGSGSDQKGPDPTGSRAHIAGRLNSGFDREIGALPPHIYYIN
jgi:hypothetical protein